MYRVLQNASLARLQKCYTLRISTWPETYVQVQKTAFERRLMENQVHIYPASDKFKWICLSQTIRPLPLLYVCLSLSWNPECLTSSPRISMGQFSMNPIGGRQSQTRQTMRCQTAVRIPSAAISDTYTRLNYFFERESAISVSSWWILFESIQLYKLYVEQLFLTALRNTFWNRV